MEEEKKVDLTENLLKTKELALRVEELELKIRDLKKPEYKKISFWTTITTLLFALLTIMGQHFISKIEYARLDDKITKGKDTLFRLTSVLSDKETIKQRYSDTINKYQELAKKYHDNLVAIQKEGRKPASIHEVSSSVQITPRVYLQIANNEQKANALVLANQLRDSNYLVPGIENIAGKAKAPEKTEVRYCFEEDKDIAEKILDILKSNGYKDLNSSPQFNKASSIDRKQHLEIWFSN